MKIKILQLIILSIFSLAPMQLASAQSFEEIIVGGKHACGYLPDGTTKIFINNNGNFEAVDSAAALKEISTELLGARKRVRSLNQALNRLKDEEKINSTLGLLNRTIDDLKTQGYNGKDVVGKSKKERITLTKALIKFAEERTSYYEIYLRNLEACRDGLRKGGSGNVLFKVVSLGDGSRWHVKVLVLIPRPLSGPLKNVEKLAHCVRASKDPVGSGQRVYMSANPCDYFVVNKSCTALFDSKSYAGKFHTGTEFGGRPSDETLAGRIAEYESIYSAGFVGRVRGDGIHTSKRAEADECNDF